MIRVLAFVAALVAALLVIWAAGHYVVAKAPPPPPPRAIDVRKQFPDRDENDTAGRVLTMIAKLDENELQRHREMLVDYLRREVISPSTETAAPPDALARFLAANRPTLRILCAELATHPTPVWKSRADNLVDTPQPDDVMITRLFLLLAADALAEHNHHNDPVSWSDLGGIKTLSDSLWTRQEIPSVLTALTGSRMIAAVATKLPAPAPRWWNDFVSFDPRAAMLRALDYEEWALRTRAHRYPAGEPDDGSGFFEAMRHAAEPFLKPIRVMEAESRVRDLREVIRRMKSSDVCDPAQSRESPWTSTIERFNRFLVEREGVARLMAAEDVRRQSGEWPARIDSSSVCKRAQWSYHRNGDQIEIAFTGKLPPPQTRVTTPLQYKR